MIVFPVTVCKGFLRETRPKHQSWPSQGVGGTAVKFFGFLKKARKSFIMFLGDVCRSPRERLTWEDIRQDIFEMRLQGSTRRFPSGNLRDVTAREHEKISVRISLSYIVPATAALRK